MGGGLVSNIAYSIFLLIMVFLVVTNYKGMVAIMAQGGTSLSQVSKTLQGAVAMGDSTQGPQVRTDRDNLQGVDIRQHNSWLDIIFSIFRQKQLTVPAPFGGGAAFAARAIQPDRFLSIGYADEYNQRIGPTAGKFVNPSHGNMAPLPTPQALIRQVTGIGDPRQGR